MKPQASNEKENDMRQTMNQPQRTRTAGAKTVPRPQPLETDRSDRIFHCHAAFLAMLGVGAVGEERESVRTVRAGERENCESVRT
jgi:hypothetical protein